MFPIVRYPVTVCSEATAGWNGDLSISEALRDPLIAILMRADGVTCDELAHLLETAARTMKANRRLRRRKQEVGGPNNAPARASADRPAAQNKARRTMLEERPDQCRSQHGRALSASVRGRLGR
jgi:hypothetical protein